MLRFQDEDIAREALQVIYQNSYDKSLKAETATKLARLGDFSIMENLLELIENPGEEGFKRANINALEAREAELESLQLLFQIDPNKARSTLNDLTYKDDFVDTLKELTNNFR